MASTSDVADENASPPSPSRLPRLRKRKRGIMSQTMANAARIERPTPEADANILSRIGLLWVSGIVWKGWRNPLRDEDLWELREDEQGRHTTARFNIAWEACKDKTGYNRLTWAFWKEHWLFFLFAGALRAVDVGLGQISPIFLSNLLSFLQKPSTSGKGEGYLWAAILFLIPLVKTFVENHYFLRTMRLGIRVRSALQGALYEKSLKMSPSARNASTVGEIVNLMQIDTQKVGDFGQFMHVLWAAPVQLIVSVGLLYNYIGPSAFIGLAITLLTIPLQTKLVQMQARLRKQTVLISDRRVKMMNEILQGIKAVKFYAWERPFATELGKIREEELQTLRATIWVRSGFTALMMSVPTIIALVTFTFFAGVFKNELKPNKVFAGIALLNQLRQPVIMLPFVFSSLIDAKLGLKRIHRFLTLENTSDYARSSSTKGEKTTEGSSEETGEDVTSTSEGEGKSESFSTDPEPVLDAKSDSGDAEANLHERGEEAYVSIKEGTFSWGHGEKLSNIGSARKKGLLSRCIPRRVHHRRGSDVITGTEEEVEEPQKESPVVLHDISTTIRSGQLTAVIGRVGAGKSSLVHAILGEMEKLKGSVTLRGSVAYAAQNAWIFNETLQNNILFGKEYDAKLYDRAIKVSSLEIDIAQLSAGDQTMIGEKGINLSGGQKQRVSIARAIYADADIYIFDDPLSALDSHVAQNVYEKVMSKTGVLRKRLRLLVTNQLQFLPECDNVILLQDGRIRKQGPYNYLMNNDPEFRVLMEESMADDSPEEEETENPLEGQGIGANLSLLSRPDTSEYTDAGRSSLTAKDSTLNEKEVRGETAAKNMMTDEEREVGNMTLKAYYQYAVACGGVIIFTLIVLFYCVSTVVQILSTWWLSYWIEQETQGTSKSLAFFLGIYFLLGLGYAIMSFFRAAWYLSAALVAAKDLHEKMFDSVMRAPMQFFDTTPIGRIISRFSRDVFGVDQLLPQSYSQFFSTVINLIGSYVLIAVIFPPFTGVAIPVAIFYYLLQRFYNRTSLEMKRLDAVSKSPIYAHFSETLGGLSTIRAYNKGRQFNDENFNKIDMNLRAYYGFIATNRWFSLYLEVVGSVLIFATALFAVIQKGATSPSNVGVALTYALTVTSILGFTVRSITEVEAQMNAVERMEYYANQLPQEAPAKLDEPPAKDDGSTVDPQTWPKTGKVEIKNLQMRYREHLELVLKGLNVTFEAGEKVGIVGRTGAGKSSLMIVLLRLVEPCGGSILIDGVDISTIGLDLLRTKVTIIPQEPVLFSGTIRFNLDPFEEYSDAEVWDALSKSELKAFVSNFDGQLDGRVSEYGQNLSVGQRQMICLTRALLRKPKVLIMDEATSSVDFETDQLIQDTIRREFVGCTVLTIAHRLWTIADYDKVLAMDNGLAGEFGSPAELLQNEDGHLTFLVNSLGENGAEKFKEMVRNKNEGIS